MKKIFLLLALFSIGAIAFSQGISVRFIGRINDTNYCKLDSVAVTNITRNWTETVVYPDTIIVLDGTGNVNQNIVEEQGLGQNIPNPFDCETRMELSVSQRENVRMQLLDVSGKVYAEYNNSLDAGLHTFDISAAAPQTYILNATIGNRSYSIRMVNTGSGCGSSIKYAGISGDIISKQTWDNESQIGDNMRYIGYTNIGGNILESEPVQQPLRENQEVVLSFRSGSTGILNGHEWVDLGLPSGTLWATCNVGANTSETYGNYFAWGETTTKSSFSESNYTYIDDPTILPPSADAATVNWGDGWRMPTKEMANELINNSTVTRAVRNGISGWLVTGSNGNSIFLPAAGSYINGDPWYHGLYWTSSIYTNNRTNAWYFQLFDDGTYIEMYHIERYDGLSVRPVCGIDTPAPSLPTVQTNDATNVTTSGATISGTIISDGGQNVSNRGFVYGTNANNLSQSATCGSGTGSFSKTLTSLNSCTTYYYRAYARNSNGTAYGELMSFSTLSIPTVTTGTVSNITGTEATFSGSVSNDCNAEVTDRGFMYGTNENNLSEVVQCGDGTGSFMGNISNLTEGTTYYYKAYATNIAGTAYGEVRSFSTLSLPIVTTGTASSIPATGATFSGSVRSTTMVTARGFIYGTSSENFNQIAQSGSGYGDFTKMLSDLTQGTTYYYKAYATNSAGTAYGDTMSFTTKTLAPTGYINGYGYVDLGLPSRTRWATCNLGSTTPEGFGNYYAWGETETKDTFTWETYRYCNGSNSTLTKYCNNANNGYEGFTDNLTTLDLEDDAAYMNCGERWKMPTKDEMQELIDNCDVIQTTHNGVNGRLFTGSNGNSIFIPAAGFMYSNICCYANNTDNVYRYWSSSLRTESCAGAWYFCVLRITSTGTLNDTILSSERDYGSSVRPVCPSITVTTGTATDITINSVLLYGNVTSDGDTTVTARGFLYGTNSSNLTQTVQCGSGTGEYTANLTGLRLGTTYYYKAYAINRIGPAYGEVRSFTTTAIAPTVITRAASNITSTRATLSGNVTSESEITVCGFLYGTSSNSLTQTVQCGNSTGDFTSDLTGLTFSTTYYYKAFATNIAGTTYGDVMSFTTPASAGILNGHNWVDLGLPSGTRWATCNVGATDSEDYGNYYAWGETTTKSTYTENNYTYSDNPTILPSSADAATINWGSGWRMPTKTEMNELYSNCTHIWTTQNGVNGRLFTGPNGNSIFLPAAGRRNDSSLDFDSSRGFYWSSSLYPAGPSNAWYLYFFSDNYGVEGSIRYYGRSVRAVCNNDNIGGDASISVPTVTTGTASNITATGATLSGNVTSDGGATITARGFLYGTNASNLTQTVQSGSGTGSFTSALTSLTSGTTYYYKAYATNSAGTAYGEVMSFTTETASTSYSDPTGYVNGYGYVDLGLPSGTKWATCNVGATNPEDYGNYYAWGETTTKTTYNSSSYTYTHSYTDNPSTLPSSADAATANWGSGWRMPTYEELTELRDQCDLGEWTTVNGVYGMLFTGPNGNSIFLPAAGYSNEYGLHEVSSRGYYWSSSLILTSSLRAYYLDFDSDVCYVEDFINRYSGLSVRAVCSVPTVTTGTASSITATGATLSGNVTSDGGATVTARGFLYGTNSSNLTQTVQSGSGTGSFTKALTGLTSGTTYYYKAYATNSAGTAYGEVRSFTTESSTVSVPTVTTSSTSNISTTGATLSGNVTLDGGATVSARGFLYGTNANNLTQTVQSGSGTGSFTKALTGLTSGTTYYYKAYATNSAGTAYGEVRSFTTENDSTSYSEPTGYVNDHGYVDLGLPSGMRWATCNVGATNPEDYGNYYAWGETTTKTTYDWITYRYCNGSYNTLTKYCNNSNYGDNGFTDSLTTLETSDDAATANWGSSWRMPTYDEMYELKNNCTVTWTTQNGVNGRLFTGPNGNSIFLPAAGSRHDSGLYSAGSEGCYWSSSLHSVYTDHASGLDFDWSDYSMFGYYRRDGQSVRPVCNGDNISVPIVTTGTATSITATGATISGNVTSDGGAIVTDRGFLYGTSASNLTQTVQSGSGTSSFTKVLAGLTSVTTYYYKAYATNSAGTAYGEVRSFTTYSEPTGYVNGYGYVDLGLPSGTKWATCNVGASTPTEYGNYYAWGETTTKETYYISTYTYTGNPTILPSSADAATANWGSGWRMPTQTEMQELIDNCTVTWTIWNGVNGRLFTGSNGNSIFLPAAGGRGGSGFANVGTEGTYWSSSLDTAIPDFVSLLYFNSVNCYVCNYDRCGGKSVRPVCNQ